MSLGEKVKKARENAGLTQPALGKIIGKTKQAISLIEKNDFSSIERIKSTLILIAQALNNNFGEAWLDDYLTDKTSSQTKEEIFEAASPAEIVTLKFGGKGRRSKSEMIELRKLLDAEIQKMEDEKNKYGDE